MRKANYQMKTVQMIKYKRPKQKQTLYRNNHIKMTEKKLLKKC